jgi:hypothetical protein
MGALPPDLAAPMQSWGASSKKLGFAAVDLGGFVSSSGNISTYQEVLIKKICLQLL